MLPRPKRQLKAAGPLIQLNRPGPIRASVALAPGKCRAKGSIMQFPPILQGESLKRLLQGAFIGSVATMIIGFHRGGWMLEITAWQMAENRANTALVAALAPMCADKFRQDTDAGLNMAELKKVSSWMQDSYIEKGGWATFPGMVSPEHGVAKACANLLTALK